MPSARPPIEIDQSEVALSSSEVAALPCTNTIRGIVQQHAGIQMESETVTRDRNYGVLYRYKIVSTQVDDGRFHPEDGTAGTVYEIEGRLIIHTLNYKDIKMEYRPIFDLGG